MIESVAKNQELVKKAITNYYNEHTSIINKVDLLEFTQYLIAQMYIRLQDEDCYFIDMLEDIERMK